MSLKEKLLGSSDNKSLEETEASLEEVDSELQQVRGKQQLEDLKEERRQQLKEKQKKLEKEKFKQTRTGALLNNVGNALDSLSNEIDGSSQREKQAKQGLMQISDNLEKVDGDGRGDNRKASKMFGSLEKPMTEDDVIGTVNVDGTVELENDDTRSGKSKKSSGGEFGDVDMDVDMEL